MRTWIWIYVNEKKEKMDRDYERSRMITERDYEKFRNCSDLIRKCILWISTKSLRCRNRGEFGRDRGWMEERKE